MERNQRIRTEGPIERVSFEAFISKSNGLAAIILLGLVSLVCVTVWYIFISDNLLLRFTASILLGFLYAVLFGIGHDAAHGSFTSSAVANRIIGRFVFLPSLHAFSLWALDHNSIHHRFTNLRIHDRSYAPLSKEEYDALSERRKRLERFYRHPLGHGAYYTIEVWWKKLFFPRKDIVSRREKNQTLDSMLVLVFLVVETLLIVVASSGGGNIVLNISTLLLIPIIYSHMAIGFIVYQQHTHETVRWYDDAKEWQAYQVKLESTVHLKLPWILKMLFTNGDVHTAHHLDARIPMYNLTRAQRYLETIHPTRVRQVQFTTRSYLRTVRACQLYDYKRHVWMDFAGNDRAAPAA